MEALKFASRAFKMVPQHLIMAESVPAGQRYSYFSTHPMRAMLDPVYFLPSRDQLRPGDTLRVCQMEKIDIFGTNNRVLAFIDLLVIASSRGGVEFHRETENPIWMPDKEGGVSVEAPVKSDAVYVAGRAKWGGPKAQWRVIDGNDEILATGIEDKALAEKIASGEMPLPGD